VWEKSVHSEECLRECIRMSFYGSASNPRSPANIPALHGFSADNDRSNVRGERDVVGSIPKYEELLILQVSFSQWDVPNNRLCRSASIASRTINPIIREDRLRPEMKPAFEMSEIHKTAQLIQGFFRHLTVW
jgi:hypothetical protein